MMFKCNVLFTTQDTVWPLWIILIFLICEIPSSFLLHDQYLFKDEAIQLKNDLHEHTIKRFNKYVFKHSLYNVTIPENSVGKTYVIPELHNDRMGLRITPSSDVKYRIISGDRDKIFKAEERIVGDFAFLTIRTRTSNVILNREKNDEYFLKIKAVINYSKEHNISSYESDTLVYIKVLDRNDLSPLFYPTEYYQTIPEDMPIHKPILRVLAEDADLGINGEIYYSFMTDNEYFSIHPTSGIIILTSHLKYAKNSNFELVVLANDRGALINHYTHQASKAKVFITVEQVNIHAPEIYVKTLSKITTQLNAFICGIVRVNDKDIGRHGEINKLEIVDGDAGGNFYIKPSHNEAEFYIKINKFAKLKKPPYIYNLTLRAEDKGIPTKFSFKIVPVQMLLENSNSPIFTKQLYEVSIPETSPLNMPVIRLKVSDPDLGKNALVFLEIVGGNEGGEFRINPDSGMLYTQKSLDAEYKSFYTLTVSAVDQANIGVRKQSSAKVKINIKDMNDNDPIFEHTNSTLEVNENELAGTFVIKLLAKDKDSGENSYISYSIANLNDVPFEIDHFTGVIKTTQLIDYETMSRKYVLSVRASDWGLPFRRQTEIELLIMIKDINDNRPQFERVSCIGKVLRSIPVGTDIFTLSAIDFDVGDFITYRIISGNEDGCFNVDTTSGVISIRCDLSDIGVVQRIINVSATDGTHFSDEMSIKIELLNIDKHTESDHINSINGYGSFECRETGVARRLAEILADAEKNNLNSLDIISINNLALTPSRYGENIHTPEFVDFPHALRLNESVQLGETVLCIMARDRDLGYNGKLIFAISDGDNDSVFRIDHENGELQVIGYLDRERQDEYNLNITVYDLGQPHKFESKMLPVTILDSNDNPPVFQKSLATLHLKENAINETIIFCFNATDADIGKNAEIEYYMYTEILFFFINKTTGCVYLIKSLDREKQEAYEVHIVAKDNGLPQLSAEAVINIIIDDINDNAPIFGIQEFIFKVREDIPRGTVVASIEARDFDIGLNGEIHYLLKEDIADKNLFKIDKYTGVIRTQGYLDYETRQVHNLIVSAIDCGNPSLTTEMPVVIEIIDVNENKYPPEFDDFVFIGKISENKPKGSLVMNISARDLDIQGPDSQLSYSIRGGDGLGVFAVNDQGSIRTLSHLDAETKNSYWLTLCAQDNAIVPLSSCVQVYIQIQNENDNVPLTDKPVYYKYVPEGSPSRTVIIQLKAVDNDKDAFQKISYGIISGNPEGYFEINSITGELTTTERKLDRENQSEHILEIYINDNGSPPLSSTTRVVVTVEDINDHSPEFDQRFYKVQVPSTIGINQSIFQVQAFDNDIGENGRITYYIKSGKGKNKFRMDANTGFIFVSKSLETDTEYDLNIRAEDNGTPKRSQTAKINVAILLISEKSPNPPMIKTTNTVVDVTESDRPGFLVTVIQATDKDGDHLWYNISGGDDRNEFYILQENGNIILSKTLDWETQRFYNLTISVTDGTHYVQTQLYIEVIDTNDNRPSFTEEVYSVNISENIEEESVILQLHATDKDEDKKIFYTLHAAQDPTSLSLFRIDSITGNVLITQRLDYEKNTRHVLIVVAKDHGTPAKRNYAKIIIEVHDHNDHYPEFTNRIIQSKILESAAIGSKIVQIYAFDRDCGKNGEIKYRITSGNVGNVFEIDSFLGILTVTKALNINQMQEYMLQVKATDLGEPPLSSQIPVHIIVTMSENDPPTFLSPTIFLEIYENLAVGTILTQVEARSSSSVFYEIQRGNDSDFFHINPSTGVIVNNYKIDFELKRSFNLTISATNMASASSLQIVIIHILDLNDNSPFFVQKEYFGEISESAGVGTLVHLNGTLKSSPLLLKASDVDVGINGMVEFSIVEEIARKYFQIDSSTGAIKLIRQIDYEQINELNFTVKVNDMGSPKLYSMSLGYVYISVLNVNDCPPVFEKKNINVTLYLPTYDNIIVTQVNATDADMEKHTKIRYDIVDGNSDDCFSIDAIVGVITTRNVQRLHSFYTLHIRASDGLYSTITQIVITTELINAEGFAFHRQKYKFSTNENSTKVSTIGLVNIVGNLLYENVEYKILNPTNMFQIGKSSGAIKTTGIIFDRETQNNYNLIIEALSVIYFEKNKYVRRAHVPVEITILDINDNCPMFVNLPYYATISVDDLKGSTIIKVTAVDLDSFENGEVRYEMKKGNGELFKIERKTGEIALRQNIEGHNRNFDLVIAAYDGAITPCSTEVSVHIKIVDKSMPIFSKQFYTTTIKEDVEIFSALSLSIQADSPLKRNLIYTITKGNEYELFECDYRTGVIYVANQLDFEVQHSYELVVRATDGVSGVFADVPVSIIVIDANDCYPEIERDNYNIYLTENLLVGSQILKINATDCDTNANSALSFFIEDVDNSTSNMFYIDITDGSIFLKNVLDFEACKTHHLMITVKDHGIPSLSSKANVWISVKDLNDNAPRFVEPSFSSILSVQAVRGQFVTVAKAYDLDYSDSDQLFYKIVEGNELQTYAINESTGIITLQNLQNFTDHYQTFLNVSVTDGIYTSYSRVKILLLPENMQSPSFLESYYEAYVKENENPGANIISLQARDLDLGKFSVLCYDILSDEMNSYFEIDKKKGIILTKVSFDREKRTYYDVIVKVTDGGGKFGFTSVKVTVVDENDNRPLFDIKEYKAIAKIDVEYNSTVLKVNAVDLDESLNGLIKYSIDNQTLDKLYTDYFSIDELSGNLRIIKAPAVNTVVQFFIRAIDNGSPQLYSMVPVSIQFLNSDLYAPEFEKSVTNLQVLESTPPGSVLTKLRVSGNFSTKFSIATETEMFFISENGEMILLQTLDREENEFYHVFVVAESTTVPVLVTFAEVYVNIQDENDNYPKFDSSIYSVEVAENVDKVTSIIKVTATDMDTGSNGDIRYFLDDDDHSISGIFDIDIYSGWITSLSTLDREIQSEYYFKVLATDNGQPKHISKVPVVIKIVDYNDNPPCFKESSYKIFVYENALPGTILKHFILTDIDSERSEIDFFITYGDIHCQFQIAKSGELFVSKSLDREVMALYHLSILATDGKFISKAKVEIEVKDINDNKPFCLTPRYNLIINESILVGTSISKLYAIDLDENGSDKLRYYLTGKDSDDFFIEKESGLVKVAKLIDREVHPTYKLIGHVQDGQELSKECVSEIFITVNDLNDNKPEFSMQQYIVSIYENAQVQTVITKVHATDKDFGLNRKVSYSFVDLNPFFSICSSSGIVKLLKDLDREHISVFNISIKAEDHGTPKLSSTTCLTINVLDINDNPPEFRLKLYETFLFENATVNMVISQVSAVSKDIGVNAEIMYFLIGGNEQNKFNIDSKTGVVYLKGQLDYEKTKSYFLTIQAIDGGTPPLSSVASMNISVLDINDNSPKFSQNIYRTKIHENAEVGETFLQVSAIDEDSSENNVIRYNIERGDRHSHFEIDEFSGYIKISGNIDRESISNYLLEVRACDNGVPELCNYVHVNIDLIDFNDNPPLFTISNYSVILQENKDLGYVLLKFNITDNDEYPNTSPYTFDFRNGNEGGFFRLEQDGTLRTAAKFNHKVCHIYNLQIRVFDNGTPPLYSDAWVNIRVVEESQYPPIITPLDITVNSFEDDFGGGFLGHVYASDQDKYDTLLFNLSPIESEINITKLFNITQNTGSLYAISNLDIGSYKVNVSVSDGKYISNAIVKVNVELITKEMVKNAVVIKFSKTSPEEFILSHRKGFVRLIRAVMHCRQKDVIIITLQNSNLISSEKMLINEQNFKNISNKKNAHEKTNLDVLFAVRKQQIIPTSEAYFTIDEIRSAILTNMEEIETGINLVVEDLVHLKCSKSICVHGICVRQIILNKTNISTFYSDVISYVIPMYDITDECHCKQGFDGKNCDEPVNACSLNPCPTQRQCWPADTQKGYQCICPQGYTGQFCENKSSKCLNSSCLNTFSSVSFSGKSYAHYKINQSLAKNSIEHKFIYSVKIRTVQQTGTLLYASGKIDYHILEILNGAIQYRFDLGSGEGVIIVSSILISDGEWHTINLERIMNNAKLIVDNKHFSQGSAPGVNIVLNIYTNDLFVGAEVRPHPSILGFEDIQRGFIGCMSDLMIAQEPLPLYISGGSIIAALKRFTNVEFSCDPSSVLVNLGVCGTQPCLNGGICNDLGNNHFKCICHARFSGKICEWDIDPCASTPCLFGSRCEHKSTGNYSCICPTHLSGKRCEYGKFCTPNPCKNGGVCEEGDGISHCMCRGYTGPTCEIDVNECDNQPCGNGATCINEAGSFRCICPSYLTGASCGDPLYSNSITTKLRNLSIEHMTGIIMGITTVFVIIIIVLCSILFKNSCSNSKNMKNKHSSNRNIVCKESNLNSHVEIKKKEEGYNKHNAKLSNLEINQHSINCPSTTNDNMFPINATFVNNLDILRSYGSAGDELDNIPFEYQKISRTKQQINTCNLNETETSHKHEWFEQMHLKTFSENKLNNESKLDYLMPLNRVASYNPNFGKLIHVAMPSVCHPTQTTDCSPLSQGQYHWDCSDWVRKSQNPLPDITEVPGAEIADSSSFHSNDSNESKPTCSYVFQNTGEVDPARDITTLNEDITSEYVDSELDSCIQPLKLRLLNNSLQRLSPLNNSENEDYKFNKVPFQIKPNSSCNVYIRHPDIYLPPLNAPSETEGERSSQEGIYKRSEHKNKLNSRNKSESSEEAYLFGNLNCISGSNSNNSIHLCEIEDSELEEFIPAENRKTNI